MLCMMGRNFGEQAVSKAVLIVSFPRAQIAVFAEKKNIIKTHLNRLASPLPLPMPRPLTK